MIIKRGKNRLVIVFPRLKLAVKFPLIHIFKAARQFFSYGFTKPYPGDHNKTLTQHLFKGIADNWREYRFYRQTRHPFCQPTYFSLLGLCNFQGAAKPCGRSMQELWSDVDSLTKEEIFKDAHHFSNPLNFCHVGKRFLILDYGHPETQKIIRQYGDRLCQCEHGLCLALD